MFFLSKKIRKFLEALEAKKQPSDLQEVVNAITANAPSTAHPQFQKNLRTKLLLTHKAMANTSKASSKNENISTDKARKKGSGNGFAFKVPFGLKGWSFALSLLLIITLSGLVSYPLIPAPEVQGYSLKLSMRKIAYNAPIKIAFSQPMDHGSVEKAFHISPPVEGKFSWVNNALLFQPNESFKIDQEFEVSLDRNAKSIFQKSLPYDYIERFKIIETPKVLLFSPAPESKDVPNDAKLTIHFDRPMTQLTTLDQGVLNAIKFKIEPQVNGKAKWLGTDTIQFIPEKLMNATHYTVTIPQGTFSAEGGQTDKDFVYSFDTLQPAILENDPQDMSTNNGPSARIKLGFNQTMALDKAQTFVHLLKYKGQQKDFKDNLKNADIANYEAVPFSASYYTLEEYKKDNGIETAPQTQEKIIETNPDLPGKEELEKTLIIKPLSPLPYSSDFLVKVDKGWGGAEGNSTLGVDTTILFKTVGDITFTTNPANGEQNYRSNSAWFYFSQSMDLESIRSNLSIEPKSLDEDTKKENLPQLYLENDGDVFISYGFKPSTNYTITLKQGTKDLFGKALDKDFVLKFKKAPLSPRIEVLSEPDLSVVDGNKPPVFYVKTTNLDSLNVRLKKLTPEDFNKVYDGGYVRYIDGASMEGPFFSWEKKIKNEFNKQITSQIDFAKESGQVLAPGYYYFDVSNPAITDDNGQIRYEKNLFVLSRSGLSLKVSNNKLLVWATSFAEGAPIAGMDIAVTKNGAVRFTGKTNRDGLATFDLNNSTEYPEFFVTGAMGDDFAVAHSSWSEGVAPWNFNVDYGFYQSKYYAYIYTDRPIYRPGHTAYFKGLLRIDQDATFKLPDVKKLHVLINDSQGEKVYEKDVDINSNGTFNGELKLGEQARTGDYSIQTSLAGVENMFVYGFSQGFHVAEYRKPDYELKLETDKKSYVNGDTAQIKVKASYFFGAPLPSAPVEWTVKSQDYFFFLPGDSQSPYASKWYSFSDDGYLCYWGCQGESTVVTQGKDKLNANGEFTLRLPLDIAKKKMSQFYTVEMTASDLNNQTVSDRVTIPIHQGEYYVGILSNDGISEAGKDAKFEVISVDAEGKPVTGKQISVSFFKRTWNTVKKKNVDSDFYYENNFDDVLIENKMVTTDGKGHSDVSFVPKDGGSFKVSAESRDARGNKILASTTVYVSSSTFVNWGRENNDRIELVPDKIEYKPGDTAHILVKSPYQNVYALVTHERGDVMTTKVMKLTTTSDVIDVPITEKSIPNLFVSVLLIKGANNKAGLVEPTGKDVIDERSVAAFKLGYTTLQVNSSSKQLKISLESNQPKYHPGDEITLKVKSTDVNGKPKKAELSISVVDKSVLSLSENVTADLLSEFYRKRYLGVNTGLTLSKALSRINIQVESGLKGGGGGAIVKRGNFKDTAYWQAVLTTNDAGEGTVKFKVPDNLTTWQVLGIGITPDTLVGSQRLDFLVTKDVLVRPVLPRFLILNDTMTVGGIVHNYLPQGMDFDVSLQATGVRLTGNTSQRIHLNSGEEKKVEFPLEVLNELQAKLTFKAVATSDGTIGDIVENTMPIHPYSFPEIVATSSVISDNDKHVETFWLPNNIDPRFGELTLTIAPTLASSISKGIEYLVQFPYGCVEQTASSLLPNLLVKQILSLPGLGNNAIDLKELQKNVDGGLQALYKYQKDNGGWGIWETSEPGSYLTAYVLFTLHEAKKAGFSVDANVMKRGADYLRNSLSMARTEVLSDKPIFSPGPQTFDSYGTYNANIRAYALYVLAEMGSGDLGLSNRLYDDRNSTKTDLHLNLFAKAYLAMDFQLLIKQENLQGVSKEDIEKKIANLKSETVSMAKESPRGVHFEEKKLDYAAFDTNTRTTAVILQMLSRIEPNHPLVPKILRYLLTERKDGHFASTQETAVGLIGLIEYLKSSHELEADFIGGVSVNNNEKIRKSYTRNNLAEKEMVKIALTELLPNNQDNEITAIRDGKTGKMYMDVNLKYYLPTEKIAARDEGLEIHQQYYSIDDKKEEKPIDNVKVGDTVKGKITVIVPEDRYYVMVEDFLPAGLEGVDFSLKTSQQGLQDAGSSFGGKGPPCYAWDCYDLGWTYFNHSEVRDDRMMYFADFLPKGVYEIEYFARATTPGKFHDLPTLAQELYFPEVFGRSEGRSFEVKR